MMESRVDHDQETLGQLLIQVIKAYWAEILSVLFLIIAVISFCIFLAADRKKEVESRFTVTGNIQSIREVYETGGLGYHEKSVYVTVAGKEYELYYPLVEELDTMTKEKQITVSGSEGFIESFEVIKKTIQGEIAQ